MGFKRQLKQRGYIRWFDNLRGEGVVTTELGQDFFVHWSADTRLAKLKNRSLEHRRKTGGPFITYERLDRVEVEIFFDSHYAQVSKITPHEWISREDLLSDKLLLFFETGRGACSEEWANLVLYNLISECEEERA